MYSTNLHYLGSNGKWLMPHCVTKKSDVNEGKYIGVGGELLEGESPEECAAREVFEEAGYTLTHYRYVGTVTFVSDRYKAEHIHLFLTDGFMREYHDTEKGISSWVPKEEILKLPLWEGDRIFLPLSQRNILFFSLKLRYRGDVLTAAKLNGSPLPLRTRRKETEAGGVPA